MTTAELKDLIHTSSQKNFYDTYTVSLHYPTIDFKIDLVGVVSIFEFVSRQADGFAKHGNDLPNDLTRVADSYKAAKDFIIAYVKKGNAYANDWNSNVRDSLLARQQAKFLYDSPKLLFLIETYRQTPASFTGAYQYIVENNVNNLTDKSHFAGVICAINYVNSNNGEPVTKVGTESRSLEAIRRDAEIVFADCHKDFSEVQDQLKQKFTEAAGQMDSLISSKGSLYTQWFEDISTQFAAFSEACNERKKELEELYIEKLRLEAPAAYWRERAKSLRKEGFTWLIVLGIAVGVAAGCLIWVLFSLANGSLEQLFSNTGTAIKWSIVFITFISFLAFGIRSLSKLTFSSFHLMRDAQEREQLTYVYLALHKEKSIDQTERHLVMQSLFSRADSGLLKDEASPTMPGNIVDKMMPK